jgi:hypothetical protein
MMDRKIEEILLKGFRKYLLIRGLEEKSVKEDISRINMMKQRNINYTKGEDYVRNSLYESDLSDSSIRSCLRTCRYYKEYLDIADN